MAALRDFIQRDASLAGVFAGGERLARLGDIDEAMRDEGAVFVRGFSGTDFEIAIDGNRVATDDLAGELLGKMDGERRLAGGCRAEDDDKKRVRRGVRGGRHSPRAPGDGLAEADEGDQ